MQFFNVGPWEVTVILMIAILVLGPKRMAEVARTIGKVSAQLHKVTREFTAGIQAELMELEKETRQATQVPRIGSTTTTTPPGPVIDGESKPVSAEVPGDERE